MWSMWNHLSNQESPVHACLQKSQSCLNKEWLNALFTLMNAGLDELIEHCLGRNPDGLWQCLYCQFSSLHKHHVKNHCEAKHISSGGVVCLNCGVTCPTRKALAMHMSRKHVNSSGFQCLVCSYICPTREALRKWLWADQMFYTHFNKILQTKKQKYGLEKLEGELNKLDILNTELKKMCIRNVMNNTGNMQYWKNNIQTYELNNDIVKNIEAMTRGESQPTGLLSGKVRF